MQKPAKPGGARRILEQLFALADKVRAFEMSGKDSRRLLDYVEQARAVLEAEDEAREKLLGLTREVVRLARQTILKLHDSDTEGARRILEQLFALVDKVQAFKASNPRLYYGGSVTAALAEYVEASVLFSYVNGEPIPGYEELRVEPVHYLLGLADFTGELRRLLLRRLSSGDHASAERELRLMEEVYQALVAVAVPEALVPGLRRKVDVLRALIESSARDLYYSATSSDLERAIRRLLDKIEGGCV